MSHFKISFGNQVILKCHLDNRVTGCFPSWGGRNDALSLFPCLHVEEGPVEMVRVDRLLQFSLATVGTAEATTATAPITAVPVAIGDTHHNQEEDEAEEDEA